MPRGRDPFLGMESLSFPRMATEIVPMNAARALLPMPIHGPGGQLIWDNHELLEGLRFTTAMSFVSTQQPYYWPLVRGIHQSPMDSPHKGPLSWKGA